VVTTSTQIREAIIRASRDQGLTYEAIADMLGIGRATVNQIWRRKRETGSVAPLPRGGGNRSPLRGEAAIQLRALVASRADLTAAELAVELRRQFGLKTSRSSVQRALVRMDYTLKKSRSSRASGTRRRTGSAGSSSRH